MAWHPSFCDLCDVRMASLPYGQLAHGGHCELISDGIGIPDENVLTIFGDGPRPICLG
jgi:hypothetical protein